MMIIISFQISLLLPAENEPLMQNEDQQDGEQNRIRVVSNYLSRLFEVCFYIPCFLSGQLMLDWRKPTRDTWYWFAFLVITLLEFPIFILFLALNIGALVFNFYAIFGRFLNSTSDYIAGPFEIQFTQKFTQITNEERPGITLQYINMLKVVVTMATLSGSLSYLIMMYILITHYSCFHKLYERVKAWLLNEEVGPFILNPFPQTTHMPTDRRYYKRTVLKNRQTFYFAFIFILNVLLFAANVSVLYYILHNEDRIPEHMKYHLSHKNYTEQVLIDYIGFATLFSSQYCAIMSCFIFSKVAYAVTIECGEMMGKYRSTLTCREPVGNTPEEIEQDIIQRLQDQDKTFYELSTKSMRPYRFWFTVHWFFYALTAFLSVAYLVETVIDRLYGFLRDSCDTICNLSILYLFLLTLEHIVLFLYPCFRAASILDARNSVIKKVCIEDITGISTKLKLVFVQYMKERKCGFVLSIFCAHIEFGFNIAYISIFLGLLGIVIKLSLS